MTINNLERSERGDPMKKKHTVYEMYLQYIDSPTTAPFILDQAIIACYPDLDAQDFVFEKVVNWIKKEFNYPSMPCLMRDWGEYQDHDVMLKMFNETEI